MGASQTRIGTVRWLTCGNLDTVGGGQLDAPAAPRHAARMLSIIAEWQQFHGPLVAFAVALGLALAGRFLRVGLLAAAAGGAGVVVGWYVITGRLWMIAARLRSTC